MTALTTLILLAGMASAETTTLTGLASKLRDLNKSTGEAVLLGAAGPEAEKALQRLQRDTPSVKVEIVRVPTMGDTRGEMERALAQAELHCALRVVPLGASSWQVDSYGDCRSPQERAMGVHTEGSDSTLSTLAALSEQVSDEGVGESPAAGSPAPSAPVPGTAAGPAPSSPTAQVHQLDRGDLRWAARSYAQGPEPVVALLESSIVGFGAGHFYSGNTDEGRKHLAVQGGSLGLYLVGMLVAANAETDSGVRTGVFVSNVGLAGFGVGRVVDIYRAPISAHDARARNLGGR
jgi:hypothetical protein